MCTYVCTYLVKIPFKIHLQLDSGSNSSTKSKGTMDSDSDQDFEILAKPVDKNMTSQSLAKFKGIYIKEDHFAEGTDDGSDIEVIKMTDSGKSMLYTYKHGCYIYITWIKCIILSIEHICES